MRSFQLVIGVSLLFIQGVFSQINVGVRGGLSANEIKTKLYVDAINNLAKPSNTMYIGGFVEVPLTDAFSFVPSVEYAGKGFTVKEGRSFKVGGVDIPFGVKAKTQINYIQTPIMLRYGQTMPSGLKLFADLGPSVGYATSATFTPQASLLIDFNLPRQDIPMDNGMINRWDISANIGGGVQYPIGNGYIGADLRYQHSFTDMLERTTLDASLKNRSLQLGVSYVHRI